MATQRGGKGRVPDVTEGLLQERNSSYTWKRDQFGPGFSFGFLGASRLATLFFQERSPLLLSLLRFNWPEVFKENRLRRMVVN